MRKGVNKSLAWVLVALLIFGVCPVSYAAEQGAQETNIGEAEVPWEGALLEAQAMFDIVSDYPNEIIIGTDDDNDKDLQQAFYTAADYYEDHSVKSRIVLQGDVQIDTEQLSNLGAVLLILESVDVAIVSADSEAKHITGKMNMRHLQVEADAKIVFDGKVFLEGRNNNGAGSEVGGGIEVVNGKKLTLELAKLANCRSGNATVGGSAIRVSGTGGELILNNCEILNNRVDSTGGAVAVTGKNSKLTINGTETLINSNFGTAGTHAAVYVSGADALFTMNAGQITNNTASATGSGSVYLTDGAKFVMNGGKIAQEQAGSGVYADNAIVDITYGEISGNKANGIYSKQKSVTVNGSNVKIINNQNDGIIAQTILFGPQGEISGNTRNGISFYTKGATLTMNGGLIKNNQQSGIYNDKENTEVEISAGEISYNKAHGINMSESGGYLNISGTTDINNNNATDGGGVYQTLGEFDMEGGTIRNHTVSGNGGGIWLGNSVVASISGGTIVDNKAANGGGAFVEVTGEETNLTLSSTGAIKNNEATANGGGIYLDGAVVASSINVNGGEVSGNKAQNGAGIYATVSGNTGSTAYTKVNVTAGKVSGNIASVDGGGIYADIKVPVTISGGEISGNTAVDGAGVYTNVVGNSSGVANSVVLKATGTIKNNTASKNGGGVYLHPESMLEIDGATAETLTITKNTASQNGGGVYIAGAKREGFINVNFNSGIMSENKAISGRGGAISVENVSRIKAESATAFSNNKASNSYIWDITEEYYRITGNKLLHDNNIKTPATGFTTPHNNAYNNDDIGYTMVTLTYDKTTGSGSKRSLLAAPGDQIVVESITGFAAPGGYRFKSWNTNATGTADTYRPTEHYLLGDTNAILYAVWETHASGGSGDTPAKPKPPEPDPERTILRVDALYDGRIIYQEIQSAEEGKIITYLAPDLTGYALTDDFTQRTLQIAEGVNQITFKYDKIAPLALDLKEHIKYINGYPNGTVLPDDNITRAEAVAIFYRLLDAEDTGTVESGSFHDVANTAWYATAVNYLASKDVVSGYPDGNFKPNAPITRAEFTAIASRFDDLGEFDTSMFTDVPSTNWASSYINSAAAKGWVSGFPGGTFKPNDNITRVQVVAIVNKMLLRKIIVDDIPETVERFTDLTSYHWGYADMCEAINEHEHERKANGDEIWLWE